MEARALKNKKLLFGRAFLLLTLAVILTFTSCTSTTTPELEKIPATTAEETSAPTADETPAPAPEEPANPPADEASDPEGTTPQPDETPAPLPVETPTPNPVKVTDKGNYYEVVIDYTTGKSPREIMQVYGQILSEKFPDIQADIDQFLYDLIYAKIDMYIEDLNITVPFGLTSMAVGLIGAQFMQRVNDVKPQIPSEYAEEVEGLASTLTDTTADLLGDGQLSKNELYFYHLMGDIARTVQCSAIGVSASFSETGGSIVGRNFDLDADLEGYGSVTRIKKDAKSVYIIGWLGNLGALTGFSDDGIFGAIVDTTGSGKEYSSTGIHAYAFDLRYALESESTIEGAADYMSQHLYGFNHLVFLADSEKSGVLENNLSGTGINMRRELRTVDSELNPGIEWEFNDVIVAVSAFMLKGNHDNFTEQIVATSRLYSYKTLLTDAFTDGTVNWEELKDIQSYDGADGIPSEMAEGDLYNLGTRRIVVFQPGTLKLEIYFSQTPLPADDPAPFEIISVPFN